MLPRCSDDERAQGRGQTRYDSEDSRSSSDVGGNAGSEGGKRSGGDGADSGSQGNQGDGADTETESRAASLCTDQEATQYCGDESKRKNEFVMGVICGVALFE